tara:strand:- start:369 stop:494 length:126 start_codon:yes stop_codon:yes gene_type:complete
VIVNGETGEALIGANVLVNSTTMGMAAYEGVDDVIEHDFFI